MAFNRSIWRGGQHQVVPARAPSIRWASSSRRGRVRRRVSFQSSSPSAAALGFPPPVARARSIAAATAAIVSCEAVKWLATAPIAASNPLGPLPQGVAPGLRLLLRRGAGEFDPLAGTVRDRQRLGAQYDHRAVDVGREPRGGAQVGWRRGVMGVDGWPWPRRAGFPATSRATAGRARPGRPGGPRPRPDRPSGQRRRRRRRRCRRRRRARPP